MTKQIKEEDKTHLAWYEEAKTMKVDGLQKFVKKLTTEYGHDYGTICHALAASAIAAAQAVNHSPAGGITGFQAGAVMWEFIKHWMHLDGKPLRLVDYEDMLYPQYAAKFQTISKDTWKHLKEKAEERLSKDSEHAHENVIAHWKSVASGRVPFGYRVEG